MALIQDQGRSEGGLKACPARRRRNVIAAQPFIGAVAPIISIETKGADMGQVRLPEPKMKGAVSVEEAIRMRRSVRGYGPKEVSPQDISQLLWAAQGITDRSKRLRANPSAGALYPLEIYVVKQDGVFRYIPGDHSLEAVSSGDAKGRLADACLGQHCVQEAAIDIVIAAVYERATSKYGQRGMRYTDMEAGHVAQNVFLQAVALGLDSVPVGAFDDDAVAELLALPKGTRPSYVLPVGYKK